MVAQHHEVTRLEGFSDAVFGFALTLLVVSLEVPSSFDALKTQMPGFLGFALKFAMVCWIWYEHSGFFRHTGLQDAWTVFLNSVLLFVVLFYVYPLKYLSTALLGPMVGLRETGDMGGVEDGRFVMLVYSTGIAAIFGIFVLLYRHAWRKRAELQLDASNQVTLRFKTRAHLISFGLGVLSITLALIVPGRWMWIAGAISFLMGPLHAWNGRLCGRAKETLVGA